MNSQHMHSSIAVKEVDHSRIKKCREQRRHQNTLLNREFTDWVADTLHKCNLCQRDLVLMLGDCYEADISNHQTDKRQYPLETMLRIAACLRRNVAGLFLSHMCEERKTQIYIISKMFYHHFLKHEPKIVAEDDKIPILDHPQRSNRHDLGLHQTPPHPPAPLAVGRKTLQSCPGLD